MNHDEIKSRMFSKFGWVHGAALSEALWNLVWEYSHEYGEEAVMYYMSDFDEVRKVAPAGL